VASSVSSGQPETERMLVGRSTTVNTNRGCLALDKQ